MSHLTPISVDARRLSFAGELAVVGSSLFFVGSFLWFPLLIAYFFRKVCTTRWRRLALAVVVMILVYVPVKPWDKARRNWLWDQWIRYFSARIIFEQPLDKSRPAIFCMSPHGLYPFAQAIALTGRLSELFNDMRPVTADVVLKFPVFRHLLGWVGAIGASPGSMRRHLQAGDTLCLIPGGIAEMFYSTSGDTVLLKSRKGFVRLALEHGTDIVPAYCFGNTQLLKMASWVKKLEWISRLTRVSLLFFWGRWGLPVPFKTPLLYVVGAPIQVPKMPRAEIQQAHVDAIHEQFVEAMKKLFDKYKEVAGQSGQLNVL